MFVTKLELRPGVWRLRVETKREDGTRRHRYVTFKGSEAQAEKERARLLIGLEDGRDVVASLSRRAPRGGHGASGAVAKAPPDLTISAFGERWITTREATGVIAPTTAATYRHVMRCINRVWGSVPVRDLTRQQIIDGLARLARPVDGSRPIQPRTVRHVYRRLSAILKDAVDGGILVKSPAQAIPLPRVDRSAGRIMHADSHARLLDAMKGHRLGPVVRFMLATGCRRGEVCALVWRDVDFTTGRVRIDKALAQIGGNGGPVYCKPPKSRAGIRDIALPASMLAELRTMRDAIAPSYAELRLPLADQPVFINSRGARWNPGLLSEAISRTFAALELDGFSAHDLRHHHASALLRDRQNPVAVSKRLGHSDVSITLGVYGHVMTGDDDALAESAEGMMRKAKPQSWD